MSHNQNVGRWGEQAAADYLLARGYEILGTNVRTPYGEIDLIACKQNRITFVEVKTRKTTSLGPPEISVSARKQEHLQSCASYYAQAHEIDHWQIDVIAIELRNGQPKIVHFENAV